MPREYVANTLLPHGQSKDALSRRIAHCPALSAARPGTRTHPCPGDARSPYLPRLWYFGGAEEELGRRGAMPLAPPRGRLRYLDIARWTRRVSRGGVPVPKL